MEQPWVVIPCYNEADRLDQRAFERSVSAAVEPMFLFVDDGSTDDTQSLLSAVVAVNPDRCRVLVLPENRGKAEAVRAGMRLALDEGAGTVGFWDADLATPLLHVAEFAALLEEDPGTHVVMGSRVRMLGRHIDRSGARHLIGRAYATLASAVLGLPVYDTQCGAKLFRRSSALEQALAEPFSSRWSFDVELLLRLQRAWGDRGIDRIVEVPLMHWRNVGNSKVSLVGGGTAFVYLLSLLPRSSRSLPLRTPALFAQSPAAQSTTTCDSNSRR
jgi:dolichyl-phosphate beta-glucosyltransferase